MSAAGDRANILFAEVEREVKAGRTIRVSKHDTARRLARHVNTQKRFIGLNLTTFALTASIAVLGGPITAAVALGGTIVGYGLSLAWERLTVWWSKGKYLKKKKAGLTVTKSEEMTLADGNKATVSGFMVDEYKEILDDVKTVLKGKGLTDVYNAVANLDLDFQRLAKFINDPQISGEWTKGTFGATRANIQAPTPPVRINSCNEAVELWETVCRTSRRYGEVAETHAMLDEFILHIALATSRYDANERRDLRKAWKILYMAANGNARQLFDSFNLAINIEGIQKYAFRKLSRMKDYSGWVYALIPDYIKADWTEGFRLDMALEVLRRNNEAEFKKIKAQILASVRKNLDAMDRASKSATAAAGRSSPDVGGFVKDVTMDYIGSVVSIPDDITVEDIGGALKSQGITIGSAYLSTWLNSMMSESWQRANTPAGPTGDLASLSSNKDALDVFKGVGDPLTKFGPGVIMGIVTSVVKVAIEAANTAWNERKLSTGMTLDITGMRQQSIGERIGTLRTFAREEIEDYVELLDEWETAYTVLSGGTSDGKGLFGAFLSHLKCSSAYYSNRTGQFFEELVFIADEMKTKTRRSVDAAEEAIRDFVARTDHRTTCRGNQYCYGSLASYFEAWLAKTPVGWITDIDTAMPTLLTKFDGVPARMVAGNSLEMFKQSLISTLPKAAQAALRDVED